MNIQVKPTALPATREDLLARKTMSSVRNLNDDVDRIHVALWDNEAYRGFLDAVFDEDTKEGAKIADDLEAAAMIKKFASEHEEFAYIARKNKMTIRASMNTVLRRYHMSRKERAMTVSGEVVPNNGNASE